MEKYMEIPEWLNRNEYPFEHKYYKTQYGRMHYVDEGEGEAVVMVHGNPSWSFEYRNVIKELSKKVRCIAPDHIGFGLSDKPSDFSYLPEDHAENFSKFMNSLKLDNITLVLGDWGGPIALSYAINNPDKIKNIVITNTWLWSVKWNPYYIGFSSFMGGPIGKMLIKNQNYFATSMVRTLFGDKARYTQTVADHYEKPFENPEERTGNFMFPRHIIKSSKWLNYLWDNAGMLRTKNSVIAWGLKDIAFKEKELLRWKEFFPYSRRIYFKDAGHFFAEEKPVELANEIKKILKIES
jgi:haloalkane dehalogenase